MSHDPNKNVRYPLTWPFWLAERAAEAAGDRAMSVATWLREAAIEKLERAEKEAGQPVVNRAGRLTQDEPRHHVTDKGGQP